MVCNVSIGVFVWLVYEIVRHFGRYTLGTRDEPSINTTQYQLLFSKASLA